MSQALSVEREGAVATVTLERPEFRNTLSRGLAQQLRVALHDIEIDEAVRCVVLRGAGGFFCAGTDWLELHLTMAQMDGPMRRAFCLGLVADAHASIRALRRMPKPVVASLTGPVAGLGLGLALAADLALADEDATLAFGYGVVGASPQGGLSLSLARLIGERRALGLAFDGSTLSAAAALDWGLVNQVAPTARLDAEVDALAERLSHGPTGALARTKALVRAADGAAFDAQLEREAESFAASAATADFAEGIAAFLSGRPPQFRGA